MKRYSRPDAANRFVPCEACGIEVPRFLATVEPQSGGHLCDACVLELTEAAKSGHHVEGLKNGRSESRDG